MDTVEFEALRNRVIALQTRTGKELKQITDQYHQNQNDSRVLYSDVMANLDFFMERIARQQLLSSMIFFLKDANMDLDHRVNAAKRVLMSELCNFPGIMSVAFRALDEIRHKEAALLLDKFFSGEMVKVP